MTELQEIKNDIKEIKENHLAHIYAELKEFSVNQRWLMRFFWIFATVMIGGLVKLLFFS